MAEYIERDLVLEVVEKLRKSEWYNDENFRGQRQARHDGFNAVVNMCLLAYPAADVVPVKHGEWIAPNDDQDFYKCSECNVDICGSEYTPDELGMNYCPNCGAKMDG